MSVITDLRHQIDPEPDWDDDENLVVAEQPETHCYWNPRGQLVLRQRMEVFEDNPFLIFSVENVPALIRALQQRLAEFQNAEDLPEPQLEQELVKQRPLTAAERKRRSRQRRSHETQSRCHDSGHENRDGQRDMRNEPRDEPALLFSSDG
jgi:hypothetical protein